PSPATGRFDEQATARFLVEFGDSWGLGIIGLVGGAGGVRPVDRDRTWRKSPKSRQKPENSPSHSRAWSGAMRRMISIFEALRSAQKGFKLTRCLMGHD